MQSSFPTHDRISTKSTNLYHRLFFLSSVSILGREKSFDRLQRKSAPFRPSSHHLTPTVMPALPTALSGHTNLPNARLPAPCAQQWQALCFAGCSRHLNRTHPHRYKGCSACSIVGSSSGPAQTPLHPLDHLPTGDPGLGSSSSSNGMVSDIMHDGKVMVTFRYPAALGGQEVSVVGVRITPIRQMCAPS